MRGNFKPLAIIIWTCTVLVLGMALIDGIWTSAEIQGLVCLISASSIMGYRWFQRSGGPVDQARLD
jgi:hypothetical protein